jgi:pimeloyl-ACP methyl ester carboxylesterase
MSRGACHGLRVMRTSSREVRTRDGSVLVVHDSGGASTGARLTVVWHHGSPQTGALLDPLLEAAAARGIRLVSYGRPSYGGSSPRTGRDVASAAGDVARIADELGMERFAAMGASGGGPHALACSALLGDRVTGVVSLAGIAPYTEDFDWFAGMAAPGGLRAALGGRDERARFAETDEFDEASFTSADWDALRGAWASLGADAGAADAAGPDGLIDDDVAFVRPWGFDVAQVRAPVLLVHGGEDRVVPPAHAEWLLRRCPRAELWLRPRDSHVSVLDGCAVAMDWLLALPR